MSDKPQLTMLDLLRDMIADDPAWAARHITNMEREVEELRAESMKYEMKFRAIQRRLPGLVFNPVTQEWEEGEERDMAYDAPEHPDKVRIGPDDVT